MRRTISLEGTLPTMHAASWMPSIPRARSRCSCWAKARTASEASCLAVIAWHLRTTGRTPSRREPASIISKVDALALAAELGNVRAACRALGIHHSTFYRWQRIARRHGLEPLRPP